MPILIDKKTSGDIYRREKDKRVLRGEPWVTAIDEETGEYAWNVAEMNNLLAGIKSGVSKNDAVLLAHQGDLKTAVKAGYILINVSPSDGMPNWHDIRMVVHQHGAKGIKDLVWQCPREVLKQAIITLDVQDWFKRVEPKAQK